LFRTVALTSSAHCGKAGINIQYTKSYGNVVAQARFSANQKAETKSAATKQESDVSALQN
jgi:hypothetical protein